MSWRHCVLQVAPVLAPDVGQQLWALADSSLLHAGVTGLAYPARGSMARLFAWLDARLGTRWADRTAARQLAGPATNLMVPVPWAELIRIWGKWACQPTADAWLSAVDRAAANRWHPALRLALGREDACLATFAAARSGGARCLYDLPTAYYQTVRSILEREQAEFPATDNNSCWAAREYAPSRCRRKQRELQAADHVVVASGFVRDSLQACGFPPQRVTVIPYGCDPVRANRDAALRRKEVLYVGNISLRKGIPRLLRVWQRLRAHLTHRLRLVGPLMLPAQFLAEYQGLFDHVPPIPRHQLAEHYARATVLVFPSAADGFGLVLNEALSCGLPVVASSHCGAPGFITPGREGLIYPFGDDDALAAALDRILSRPDEAAAMGRAAAELAQRWTWSHYRSAFYGLVMRLLNGLQP